MITGAPSYLLPLTSYLLPLTSYLLPPAHGPAVALVMLADALTD